MNSALVMLKRHRQMLVLLVVLWHNLISTNFGGNSVKTILIILSTYFALLFPLQGLSQADLVKGKGFYSTCIACHGPNAEGVIFANGPRLAGLRDSYLIVQLQKFRSGLRGAAPNDTFGAQMAGMSRMLPDEQSIVDVVAYIGTLKTTSSPRTEKDGDPALGKKYFNELACGQCHGSKAQGLKGTGKYGQNPQYDAPRLAGQHDWYLIKQLQGFNANLRGYDKGDKAGRLMHSEAAKLKNSQMIKDLVAYIGTLK